MTAMEPWWRVGSYRPFRLELQSSSTSLPACNRRYLNPGQNRNSRACPRRRDAEPESLRCHPYALRPRAGAGHRVHELVPSNASFGILVDVLAAVDFAAPLGNLPSGAASHAETDGYGCKLANAEMVAHRHALL
jgi:hypothetical protein